MKTTFRFWSVRILQDPKKRDKTKYYWSPKYKTQRRIQDQTVRFSWKLRTNQDNPWHFLKCTRFQDFRQWWSPCSWEAASIGPKTQKSHFYSLAIHFCSLSLCSYKAKNPANSYISSKKLYQNWFLELSWNFNRSAHQEQL